jgi:glycosyltransferase involved in cell wall biosynthesis
MRFLIVTDAYPPEIRSSSHLMIELAQELKAQGHDVHVLTGWPRYNLEATAQSLTFKESMVEDGIHVIRVKTLPHHNVGFLVRGVAQLLLPLQFLAAARRHLKQPVDRVIVYTPPLPLAFVGEAFRRRGARYLLNVQDLFPQNAIDLGALRHPLLIRFFRWMERRAYRWADVVTAHSEGNRRQLQVAHPDLDGRFRVLHNWVDVDMHDAAPDGPDFRSAWGLQGRYLALFAGVMGPSQGLGVLLDVAARLRDLPDLTLLLVGDGMERRQLEERARREGLDNMVFKPFVSRNDYAALVSQVDLGLVSLTSLNKTPVVPGKILGYMAGQKPVAAFLNVESDGHRMIAEASCGYSCRSDEPDRIETILRQAWAERDRSVEMGEAGGRYVRAHFSKSALVREMTDYMDQPPQG